MIDKIFRLKVIFENFTQIQKIATFLFCLCKTSILKSLPMHCICMTVNSFMTLALRNQGFYRLCSVKQTQPKNFKEKSV